MRDERDQAKYEAIWINLRYNNIVVVGMYNIDSMQGWYNRIR